MANKKASVPHAAQRSAATLADLELKTLRDIYLDRQLKLAAFLEELELEDPVIAASGRKLLYLIKW